MALSRARLIAILVIATLPTVQLGAQDANRPQLTYTALPSKERIDSVYPAAARRADLGGDAIIGCTIQTDGSLNACSVVRESPAGMGFGVAALSLSMEFKVNVSGPNASRIGQKVQRRIRFGYGPADRLLTTKVHPSREQIRQAIPARAKGDPRVVTVTLSCYLRADTALDCDVTQESIPGLGYGPAAIALLSQVRYDPQYEADRIGNTIKMTFVFDQKALGMIPDPGGSTQCPSGVNCEVIN